MTRSPAPSDRPRVSAGEIRAMRRACELAACGLGTALPNPVVGCVLIAQDGSVVGEGFHHHAGGPHAEVIALRQAGESADGATAVVTLEPCDHTGRTPPCSHALIAAGVARVVVAVRDPWATASGGIDTLRQAGIDVVDLADALGGATPTPGADDAEIAEVRAGAEEVNRVWLTATRQERTYVTLKMATTIDGRVAAADGSSRWISSAESRADAHAMRQQIDTIAVGVGTVLADDPQLTARDAAGGMVGRQPLRVVVDSTHRTPADARVIDDQAPSMIADVERFGATADGRVDLSALTRGLYREGQRHLMVEGGPRLAASFLDAGLVDEVLVYLAPMALGAGRSALEGGTVGRLADAHRLVLREARPFGPDMRLRYAVQR